MDYPFMTSAKILVKSDPPFCILPHQSTKQL